MPRDGLPRAALDDSAPGGRKVFSRRLTVIGVTLRPSDGRESAVSAPIVVHFVSDPVARRDNKPQQGARDSPAACRCAVELLTLEAWPALAAPKETGRTFEENARLKAEYYAEATAS